MILRLALISLCLIVSPLFARDSYPLSKAASISILTCAPWQGELYTAFGHSAIRVCDPKQGFDLVFNYGTFDFNQPHFYLNFTKGTLLYALQAAPYATFIIPYVLHKRSVEEQVLALTPSQKQRVFDFLYRNALPENNTYLYDYFYDNCATRIRDVFVQTLSDTLQFDSTFIHSSYTIRQLTDFYLKRQPWGDLGIDICLGLPMDKRAYPTEYMFLPDYVEVFFSHARLVTPQGTKPLVTEKKMLFEGETHAPPWRWSHPWIVFSALLLITAGVSAYDRLTRRLSRWFDTLLLGTTGLLGCLLLFLWIATDHKAAADNFNLLWALPSHVVVAFMLWGGQKKFLKYYFGVAFFITLALLLLWIWLPQQLNTFLLPVVLSLGIRYRVNAQLRK